MQLKSLLNPTDGPSIKMLIPILIPILRNTIFLRHRADASNYTAIDILAIFDIAIIGFCAWLLYYNRHFVPWKRFWHGSVKYWFSYYSFALVTILWRIPDSNPLYIIYRAGTMLILSAYIYMIFMKFQSPQSAFKGLLNYCTALMLFLFLGHLRIGDLHTNSYTVCAAVIICLALSASKSNLFTFKEMKPYIYIGLICMVLGTSSASNISFICGLVFIYSFKHNRFRLSVFIFSMLSLSIAYFFGKHFIIKILFPNKSVSSIISMHGRITLWENYIQIWLLRPFLGWGFAVGERAGKYFGYIYALSAHNGYISILINTGLLGMTFWIAFFKRLLSSLIVQIIYKSPYALAIASAFIVITVNNNSVPIIGSNWGPLATLAFCLLAFWNLWCENACKGFYQMPNNR